MLLSVRAPVVVVLTVTPGPGNGAARDPDFADGVQAAVMACIMVQLSESEHCTAPGAEPV